MSVSISCPRIPFACHRHSHISGALSIDSIRVSQQNPAVWGWVHGQCLGNILVRSVEEVESPKGPTSFGCYACVCPSSRLCSCAFAYDS